MFSLQKLLRKDDRALVLLEASALQARASVEALVVACRNPGASAAGQEVAFCRHKDRDLTQELRREVLGSFMAALDREDMEALSSALYKIPKTADKFGERLRSAPAPVRALDFSGALGFVDQASAVVVKLVHCCRQGLDAEQVKALTEALEAVETQAEGHLCTLYRELYSGRYPAVQVLALKDLYELVEKLLERCRETGDIIARIALKHT